MEEIVFVDRQGRPTGETGPKLASHTGDTKLHLAFSCYVFDDQGRLLMTQRALTKKVWPGVWTNTVCGHPLPEEDMLQAIRRRLQFELGMIADNFAVMLPQYTYKTPLFNGIIENEFCPVYFARSLSDPQPNPEEVAAYKWVKWETFIHQAKTDVQNELSWWCKDQARLLDKLPVARIFYS